MEDGAAWRTEGITKNDPFFNSSRRIQDLAAHAAAQVLNVKNFKSRDKLNEAEARHHRTEVWDNEYLTDRGSRGRNRNTHQAHTSTIDDKSNAGLWRGRIMHHTVVAGDTHWLISRIDHL